jgi:hypothetical protein
MGRALLVINSDADRKKCMDWAQKAPWGTRVEWKASKRTLPQNDLMWAIHTEIAEHHKKASGRDYSVEEWKLIYLHAWGREVRFLPALDGKGAVPIPQSSSDLSKDEMTDFIEFILAWGAENGVTFREKTSGAESSHASEQAGSSPAEGNGCAPSSPQPLPPLIRFARDLLTKAVDSSIAWKTLKNIEATWMTEISKLSDDEKDKAREVSVAMRAVRDDPECAGKEIARIERLLDCPGKIGGNGNANL